MQYILQSIQVIIWLIIVPVVLGIGAYRICQEKWRISRCYLIGTTFMWAIFEILAVPAIKLKMEFHVLVQVWCTIMVGAFLMACSYIWKNKDKIGQYRYHVLDLMKNKQKTEICLWSVFGVLVVITCCIYVAGAHYDSDDSRFVANAVATCNSDTMLLINPQNGNVLPMTAGELLKDVTSPWMIYIALLSKITLVHPAIIAHTIIPVFLLSMGYMACYLLAGCFVKESKWQVAFLVSIVLFRIFSAFSSYAGSTFLLTRVWQGKAIVAGIMMPMLIFELIRLSEQFSLGQVILITLINCATALMSGYGIVFAVVITGCFTFVYTIENKKLTYLISGMTACIPNLIFCILYLRR